MIARSLAVVAVLALGVAACGRYGPPVREPTPTGTADPTDANEEAEAEAEEASTEPPRP